MLKVLIKKQLMELFQGYFVNRKTGKSRTKKSVAVLFALFALLMAVLGFAFFMMGMGLGSAVLNKGMNWLYFALMGLLAMALGVFGSVFNTYAAVYLPKDNELLMALPIPTRTLLTARLSGVFATSLLYSGWIWIPALIAYWVQVPVTVANTVIPAVMTFVIALFVSALSCALGYVVALIAAKAKGKSYLTLILSLTVFVLYYVVYFRIVNSIGDLLTRIGDLGTTVKSWLHYMYWLGLGCDGDIPRALLVTAITLALAALCLFAVSRSFLKLASVKETGTSRKKGGSAYTQLPEGKALLKREFAHFTSVSTWMLNGGLGLLLLPVGAVFLLIKGSAIRTVLPLFAAEVPWLSSVLPAVVTLLVCVVLSMSAILSVSVSMEGKTFWQLQSLPVTPWAVLRAKEKMGIRLCMYPVFFFTAACGVALGMSVPAVLFSAAVSYLFILLVSDFALFLNLKMPNLNWTNAASLTKQSTPVVIQLFGGWAFCVGLGFGGYHLARAAGGTAVLAAYAALFLALWLLVRRWLKKTGTKILAGL